MLSPAQFDAILVPVTDLFEEFHQSVLDDIVRRLTREEMTDTAAWQLQRLTEAGMVYEDALDRIAATTGKSDKLLDKLFREAGVKGRKFDNSIYKKAGLNPAALNLSPAALRNLLAGLERTKGVVDNLTRTTATSAQTLFVKAADMAYMQVSTGTMGYDQAIRSAIKELATQGLQTISYPSGHQDQLDVAMRRTVLTGVSQTVGQIQLDEAHALGVELVQTSAHAGARPEHEVWQGKVFSLVGKTDKYPNFEDETGYGEVDGLCGINCRHSFYPFFEGASRPSYSKRELNRMEDKRVNFQGEKLTVYDASQIQRKYERTIRYYKRQADMLGVAKLDNTREIEKIRQYQAALRKLTSQTGLPRQSSREGPRAPKIVRP